MSFQDEKLTLPDPITTGGGSTTIDNIANIQFNPTAAIVNLLLLNAAGSNIPQNISDSTTAATAYNKVEIKNNFITVAGDEITFVEGGEYYHNCTVLVTVSTTVLPAGNSNVIIELVDGVNASLSDDTHYAVSEIPNSDQRYHSLNIKTLLTHAIGDKIKLKFNTDTLDDVIKIKQIKWIIMKYNN
jgi:hypothetical protein